MFKPNGVVLTIVRLVLELEAERKKVKRLERDKKCLESLLQRKLKFEVRG